VCRILNSFAVKLRLGIEEHFKSINSLELEEDFLWISFFFKRNFEKFFLRKDPKPVKTWDKFWVRFLITIEWKTKVKNKKVDLVKDQLLK
jgi:hypothetical protein